MKRSETLTLIVAAPLVLAVGIALAGVLLLEESDAPRPPATVQNDPAPAREGGQDSASDTTSGETDTAPGSDPNPTPDRTTAAVGSVRGRVVSAELAPVSRATVQLLRVGTSGPSGVRFTTSYRAQTDRSGQYRIEGVSAEDGYVVVAGHMQHGNAESPELRMNTDRLLEVPDLVLEPGIRVHGVVRGEGAPVARAVIEIRSIRRPGRGAESDKVFSTRTDQTGNYEFAAVALENFEVTVTAPGFARATRAGASFLQPSPEQRIDFDLVPGIEMRGQVVDDSGQGVAGATVRATLVGSRLPFRCANEGFSDDSGSFAISGLAAGDYHLEASREGFSPAALEAVAADSQDIVLQLAPQGGVRGLVVESNTGAAVDNFEALICRSRPGRRLNRPVLRKRFSGRTGLFEFHGLDPGQYFVEIHDSRFAVTRSADFSVERGEITTGVKVEMTTGGSVQGVIVDRNDRPIPGASVAIRDNGYQWRPLHETFVQLLPPQLPPRQARTDSQGKFCIDLIVPGTWQVAASHPEYAPTDRNGIEVTAGDPRRLEKIVLMPGAIIRGRLYSHEGDLLAEASVLAASNRHQRQVRSDARGDFVFRGLPAGEYRISVSDIPSRGAENALQQLLQSRQSARLVTVGDGDEVKIDLRLTQPPLDRDQ